MSVHLTDPIGMHVGAYFTDGDILVRILEWDASGGLGEDCLCDCDKPGLLIEIRPDELRQCGSQRSHWRRVWPAKEPV